ncbi:Putative cyclic nucleotide-gated ion channel [Arachis hypogaea]|nr:Putative cyclic nucleotide-gated ion channel [Arachis hypogaea]
MAAMTQEVIDVNEEQPETGGGEDEAPLPHEDQFGNKNLLASGMVGLCDVQFCITCPSYLKAASTENANGSTTFSFWPPPILNPHSKWVSLWIKRAYLVGLSRIVLDASIFFFALYWDKHHKCLGVKLFSLNETFVYLKCLADLLYVVNIAFQLRLAYISSKPTAVGGGYLVDDPKKIALRYMLAPNGFAVDLFLVFPFSLVNFLSYPLLVLLLLVLNVLYMWGRLTSRCMKQLFFKLITCHAVISKFLIIGFFW